MAGASRGLSEKTGLLCVFCFRATDYVAWRSGSVVDLDQRN